MDFSKKGKLLGPFGQTFTAFFRKHVQFQSVKNKHLENSSNQELKIVR